MARLRVLIVDDFAPFRRFLRLSLQARNDLQIVGEAADGLEAVHQAIQLRPDVIVLDLDLPTLNGIQVARRLGDLLPEARIIFISAESSEEVVEQALKVGAGYILKLRTSYELFRAIDTVVRGGQFVSDDIRPAIPGEANAGHDARRRQPLPPHAAGAHHEVAFYPNDALLVMGFVRYIEAQIHHGNVTIAIATEPHRIQIREALQARGLHMDELAHNGRYLSLDSMESLSLFMVDDWPDALLFRKVVGGLIKATVESAKERHQRVAACGELAPILWAKGNRNAAIEIEKLWDEISGAFEVDTLCGYASAILDRDRHLRQFNHICAAHSAVHFR